MLFSATFFPRSFGSFPLAHMVKSDRPGIWVCMKIGSPKIHWSINIFPCHCYGPVFWAIPYLPAAYLEDHPTQELLTDPGSSVAPK